MEKYSTSDHIKQISLSGILLALATVLSFATFNFGGGYVYLIGIAIFLMPLCLKFPYMLMTAITAVTISDAINGWIINCWISMIAYGGAVVIIWLTKQLKLSIFYIVGLFVAAGFVIATYYFLELAMWGKAFAIKDVIATSIQFAIVVPTVSLLYIPFKVVLKATNIITK